MARKPVVSSRYVSFRPVPENFSKSGVPLKERPVRVTSDVSPALLRWMRQAFPSGREPSLQEVFHYREVGRLDVAVHHEHPVPVGEGAPGVGQTLVVFEDAGHVDARQGVLAL